MMLIERQNESTSLILLAGCAARGLVSLRRRLSGTERVGWQMNVEHLDVKIFSMISSLLRSSLLSKRKADSHHSFVALLLHTRCKAVSVSRFKAPARALTLSRGESSSASLIPAPRSAAEMISYPDFSSMVSLLA